MKSNKRIIFLLFVLFFVLVFSAIIYHSESSNAFMSLFNCAGNFNNGDSAGPKIDIVPNPHLEKFRDLDAPTSIPTNAPNNFINGLAGQIFFPKHLDPKQENFTLIIQTYHRMQILPELLAHYCQLQALHKILLLWNDVTRPVPSTLQKLSCRVTLKILQMKENKMTNRFVLRPEIETDAVMIMDDDRWINLDDVLFSFRTWQEFRHKIVGFECRMHSTKRGKYHYNKGEEWKKTLKKYGYSMMITPHCILHRAYLELFNTPIFTPKEVLDYINREMNCDDIAINFVVAKFLELVAWPQASALLVIPKHKIKNLEKSSGYNGLSVTRNRKHYTVRSECLNKLSILFNGLPLHYTHVGVTYIGSDEAHVCALQ